MPCRSSRPSIACVPRAMRCFVLRVERRKRRRRGGLRRRRRRRAAPAQAWRAALARGGAGAGTASSGSALRDLPQRRDRAGDALPQDALVVAQPPPAHVCGSCLDRLGFRLGSGFDLGSGFAPGFLPWLGPGVLSSAVLSAFFSGVFSALGCAAFSVRVSRLLRCGRRRFGVRLRVGLCVAFDSVGVLARRLGGLGLCDSGLAGSDGAATVLSGVGLSCASGIGGRGRGSGISSSSALGSSSFGTSMTKRPSWRSRPATLPASSPAPK